jgi:hypothetical protein
MQYTDYQQKSEFKPEFMDKTIRADEAAYEGFRQLAKECKLSNAELLAAMVQYFRVTKADPREPTGPDLTSSLARLGEKIDKLNKATIGFIREQEKNFLKPILAEVQAHKVLSNPAPGAPARLSEDQVRELSDWFLRFIRRAMRPALLTETFLAGRLAEPPAPGKGDPGLNSIKHQLTKAVDQSFRPEMLIPQTPAPAVAPVSPPAKPA